MKALLVFLLAMVVTCGRTSHAEETTPQQKARLKEIQEEAKAYAERVGHVISEKQMRENAKKENPSPDFRRIYLKLPLDDVRFHWKFQEKAILLAGNLTLTIKRGETTETLVIFHDGAVSDEWEILPCCEPGPDEMYFGFTSKQNILVSEKDRVELKLSTKGDVKGIGPDKTGILKQGDYASFTQFKIYHLEKTTGEKDVWAFLNNDGWNINWKMEVTSQLGWMGK